MIQLGYAEDDITPSGPIDLCGYTLREGPGTDVLDPLKIRWLALRDTAGNQALLGSADLISFSRQTFADLRSRIQSGLTADQNTRVGLATTHTHSGPATVRLKYCGRMDKSYLDLMKSKVVATGIAAGRAGQIPVDLVIGTGTCDVNINRRYGESGSVDNEVLVLGFISRETGKPVATIVNYACHPVVLGHESNGISADYPGYLTARIQQKTGAPSLYVNGACGDVNPRNDKSIDPLEAKKTGEAIADAAITALQNARPVTTDGELGWYRQKVTLPVHKPKSAAEFKDRLTMLEERFGIDQSLFADRVARDIRRLAEGTYPAGITIELTLLTFGDDTGIIFVPGELFSSLGMQIKKLAGPRKLLISGFSNGSVGYLPDRQAYKDGGYEPYFANFFYDFPEFDPSLGEVIVDGAQSLLQKAERPVAI